MQPVMVNGTDVGKSSPRLCSRDVDVKMPSLPTRKVGEGAVSVL